MTSRMATVGLCVALFGAACGSEQPDVAQVETSATLVDPDCELDMGGIGPPPATTFEEYANSTEMSPLTFVGRVVVVRVDEESKAEAAKASKVFDEATARRFLEVEVVDAVDRSAVGTTLKIHESSTSFNPTTGKDHGWGGPACYRFDEGSEAIVALGSPDPDGTRELRGGDASFFVIEDGRLSPELAEARAGTELADYPIVQAAARLSVDEFWTRIEQAAARR